MPRKKKEEEKKRAPRKPRPRKSKKISPRDDEKLAYCREWLIQQKKIKKKEKEVPPSDLLPPEEPEKPKNVDVSFAELTRNVPKEKLLHSVLFECEWIPCGREFQKELDYFAHIREHVREIVEREEEERESKMGCKWDICRFATTSRVNMSRHVFYHAFHTKIKTYGASLCTMTALPGCKNDSRQRNLVQDIETDYFCHWGECKAQFPAVQDFYDHVKQHCLMAFPFDSKTVKAGVACCWYGCRKTFEKRCQLEAHVLTHTGEKVIACHNCGVAFSNRYKLVEHLRRQVEGGKYQCAQCLRCFATEKLLREHMRMHVNCFKCTLCDMSCVKRASLAKHIRYRHLKERPFKCQYCDHAAVTKTDLENHLNTHDPEFLIACPVAGCGFTCKTMRTLKRHEERVHEGTGAIFRCHLCPRAYSLGNRLSKHLVVKHKFQLPSGHSRFLFRQDEEGFFRLQTMRVESLEVTRQIMGEYGPEDEEEEDEASLAAKEDLDETGQLTIADSVDGTTPVKRIEDFDVMKKYLKSDEKRTSGDGDQILGL